jgi:integrase
MNKQPFPYRDFDRVLAAAGIAKLDPTGHKVDIDALRHTFGTRLLRAGAGLIQVQKWLGHSDPKLTSQTYSHLRPTICAVRSRSCRAPRSR